MSYLPPSKSQNVLVYVALIAFVITALIIMSSYIQRRIQGVYQAAGDAISEGEVLGD